MQGGGVAVPPTVFLSIEISHDVVGTTVGRSHPRVVEQLGRVGHVGKNLGFAHTSVHPVDHFGPEPPHGFGGHGEAFSNHLCTGYHRTELGDQGLSAQGGETVQCVSPPDGEPLGPQRGTHVGDGVRRGGWTAAPL